LQTNCSDQNEIEEAEALRQIEALPGELAILRENRTGEFENEIPLPPNPDDWFKAKIVVSEKAVKVFVEGVSDPVLNIERLTGTTSNKIGLWIGHGSSGRFRNLVLKK
jgi:hypothetical protein